MADSKISASRHKRLNLEEGKNSREEREKQRHLGAGIWKTLPDRKRLPLLTADLQHKGQKWRFLRIYLYTKECTLRSFPYTIDKN